MPSRARFQWEDWQITLLDTPGHVDFSPETERTLPVLDCAILLVSGADGVQGHTETLWKLLARAGVPTFVFVNKMDQPGVEKAALLEGLRGRLSEACVDFTLRGEEFCEALATSNETLLEAYLQTGALEEAEIARLVGQRKVFRSISAPRCGWKACGNCWTGWRAMCRSAPGAKRSARRFSRSRAMRRATVSRT